jgi:hypothetical protein
MVSTLHMAVMMHPRRQSSRLHKALRIFIGPPSLPVHSPWIYHRAWNHGSLPGSPSLPPAIAAMDALAQDASSTMAAERLCLGSPRFRRAPILAHARIASTVPFSLCLHQFLPIQLCQYSIPRSPSPLMSGSDKYLPNQIRYPITYRLLFQLT